MYNLGQVMSLRNKLGIPDDKKISMISITENADNLTIVAMPMRSEIKSIVKRNDGFPMIVINSAIDIDEQYFYFAAALYNIYETDTATDVFVITDKIDSDTAEFALHFLYPDAKSKQDIKDIYKAADPLSEYATEGYYIHKAKELLNSNLISTGLYEEILLTAFRDDVVFDAIEDDIYD